MGISVRFWGVRGSIACPSSKHIVYGGNTSCVQIEAGGMQFVCDCGTGIRSLGQEFVRRGVREATLLMSHTHWDHICGFPFFSLAFIPDAKITIMGGHEAAGNDLRSVFARQMENPTFPVPLEIMQADINFENFDVGGDFSPGNGVVIKTHALNHPGGATGYRVEHDGKAVCYITDVEHVPGKPDEALIEFIRGADLVIYDSTYTDEEFPQRVGWGHSTWQEGVRLSQAADVGKLAIFHHDPEHEDSFMVKVEEEARKMWSGAFVAREGMSLQF